MTCVLVTRPERQAEILCKLLEQSNIQALRFPLLEIQPLLLKDEQIRVFEEKPEIDWVVFVSANAVQIAFSVFDGKIFEFCKKTKIAVIGQATAKAVQSFGLVVHAVPTQGFTSEALLSMPEFQNVKEQRFLCVRGLGGREVLAETLRVRGARVDYLEVYQRIFANSDSLKLSSWLESQVLDLITINSGEALSALMAKINSEALHRLLINIPLIVVSERLRLQAAVLGFSQISVSDDPSDSAVFKQVISLVSGEYSG